VECGVLLAEDERLGVNQWRVRGEQVLDFRHGDRLGALGYITEEVVARTGREHREDIRGFEVVAATVVQELVADILVVPAFFAGLHLVRRVGRQGQGSPYLLRGRDVLPVERYLGVRELLGGQFNAAEHVRPRFACEYPLTQRLDFIRRLSLVPGALPRVELAGFGDCVDGRGALGDGLARRFADGDQLLGGQGRQLGGRGQVLRAEPFGARGLDL